MVGTPQSDIETVRKIFKVLNDRNADGLLPYWAEDLVEEFPTGTLRGREAVRTHFAALFAALPDFHIEVKAIAQNGEVLFVRWRITGTISGVAWMGLKPTGSRIELDGIDSFTFRDGLVHHNFIVYDQMSFARQLGMMPPDGSGMDRGMKGAFNVLTRMKKLLGSGARDTGGAPLHHRVRSS
jgi:predicted ester cyclase